MLKLVVRKDDAGEYLQYDSHRFAIKWREDYYRTNFPAVGQKVFAQKSSNWGAFGSNHLQLSLHDGESYNSLWVGTADYTLTMVEAFGPNSIKDDSDADTGENTGGR